MEFPDMPHLESVEWKSFVERSARAGVAQTEAERIATEAIAAGVHLLPAPDSVTAPRGTLVELTADSLRVCTADADLGKWFGDRHPTAWPNGWESGKWSSWLGEEECLAKASGKIKGGICTLDAAGARRATLTAERLAVVTRAVRAG